MGMKRCIHCFNGCGKNTMGETCLACAGMGTVWAPDPKQPTASGNANTGSGSGTKSSTSSGSSGGSDLGGLIVAVFIIVMLIGMFGGA